MHIDFACVWVRVRTALRYDITVHLFHSKLSFRTLHDFDLNEAIDVYDFFT